MTLKKRRRIQRLLKQTSLSLLIISISSIGNISADNLETEVIEACQDALTKCSFVITEQEQVIKSQDKAIKEGLDREKTLRAQRDNPLKSPVLWGIVGLILGFVIAR